jgi:hypothetical protein
MLNFTEIATHYAFELISKMLTDDPSLRMTSSDVVEQLNAIGIKVANTIVECHTLFFIYL